MTPQPKNRPSSELSTAAVGRMSLYLRELRRLDREGITSIKSTLLGRATGVSDALIRRDLSQLGSLGRRGQGYPVRPLVESICRVLGINQTWNAVLIGAGSLGNALLRYRGFADQGFQIVAAFDASPQLIGRRVAGLTVQGMETLGETIASRGVTLAIIAVPAGAAREVAQELERHRIRGILNFAPANLQLRGSTRLVNVDLASELQRLSFAVVSSETSDPDDR